MTIAGLFAGLISFRRHLKPRDATPNTHRTTMKLRESILYYLTGKDLLIRRSRVRDPPGSYTYAAAPSRVAGELAGQAAEKRRRDRIATFLRIRQVERDRELALINVALKSGNLFRLLSLALLLASASSCMPKRRCEKVYLYVDYETGQPDTVYATRCTVVK
jgi:hypothetical protein